jgi:tetratricopeptide (TPR) repeat protein
VVVEVQASLARYLALAMVLVFLFSLVAVPLHVVSAQEDEGLRVKADMLIKIANKSKERVEAVLETVAAIPDEAKLEYEAGVSALGEAEKLRDDGEYQQASEKAVEAMRHFKEAFVIINKVAPEKPKKTEMEAEKAMGLKVAISRAEAFKEKVEGLADRAEEQGYDVSEVRTKLEEAETHLQAASEALKGGDVDLSAKELAQARKLLGEAMGELHKITVKLSSERAEKFVEKAEQKLSIVRKKIIEISDKLPPQARVAILKALEEAENSLKEAKSHIKAGQTGLAVSDLVKHKALAKGRFLRC